MIRRAAALGGTAALGAVLLGVPGPAAAIPPGGASSDTPGTSSTVSPRTLAAGQRISFSVTGFPAGETLNVKIDDGEFCSEAAVHGACVVHTQKIRSDGTVSGDFRLPADLGPGAHWLRYLASTPIVGADGSQQGIKGFTLRGGSDFTVRAAGAAAPTTRTPARTPPAPTSAAPTTAAPTSAPAPAATTAAQTSVPAGAGRPAPGPTTSPAGAVATVPVSDRSEGSGAAPWLLVAAAAVAMGGSIGYLAGRRGRRRVDGPPAGAD